MIFVDSMSDLSHKEIDREFIDQAFDTMEAAHWHIYQVPTKRSSFMRRDVRDRHRHGAVPEHIWLGVSVEDAEHAGRIEHLWKIRSPARFISFEPLLGPIGAVDLSWIAWAIIGGESGPKARPMAPARAAELRDRCRQFGIAFFFKQRGGPRPKSGGRLLDGREWNGFPWQVVPGEIRSRFADNPQSWAPGLGGTQDTKKRPARVRRTAL